MSKFKVWCPADGETADDARIIEAHDAQDAAAEWGNRDDYESADYTIIKGCDKQVTVACEDHPPRSFVVRGESVARYSAVEQP